MKSYVIFLDKLKDDNNTICYSTNSDKAETVKVKIYNQYFENIEYDNEVTIPVGGYCWTSVISKSRNRYIEFIDSKTNEMVGLFGLNGTFDYRNVFKHTTYIKNILPFLDKKSKEDIQYIMNEIYCLNTYNNDFLYVEDGDVVIDIGFNYGLFSLQALDNKPKRIIGFEPNTQLVKWFNENIKDDRIELHETAVSNKSGVTKFYENDYFGKSTIYSDINTADNKQSYLVKVINFNEFIETNNISKIDYLKIDCEGGEYDIIESIPDEYLRNNIRKIVIEFHHNIDNPRVINLFNKLDKCGFEIKKNYEHGAETGMIYARK
jgi:FkbM family methyltransferase